MAPATPTPQPARPVATARARAAHPARWLAAHWAGRLQRARFAEVRRFCLFVGHPRSGHSLVGALLNAHRNAVVCHELDAMARVRDGCSRDALYWWILRRDGRFTAGGSVGEGYPYAIPGQWQGRFEALHVVGDKRAGAASRAFAADPTLLDRLRGLVGVPLRMIQVVRNPWDNVATIARREARTLEDAADYYFWLWDVAEWLAGELDADELATVRHEALIAEPVAHLEALCRHLDLSTDGDYLAACAKLVWSRPAAPRHDVAWPDGLPERIGERSARHPRLAGYEFGA